MWKLVFLLSLSDIIVEKRQIPIGAIFYDNYEAEIAFRYTAERINMHEQNFELIPLVRHVSGANSYKTEKIVCDLVSQGITAIFGPSTILNSGITSSICKSLEIPHIITHWKPQVLGSRKQNDDMTINIYPDTEVLAHAFAELIRDYDWKSYTIIYENYENLIKLKDVLQIHGPKDRPITVKQLPAGSDYRPLLKEILNSGETNVVIDVSADKIVNILRQANIVQMLDEYQSYIITSLDTHVIDFEELRDTAANITSLRIMDPNSFELKNAVHDWMNGERRFNRSFHISPEHVQTESALFSDAVKIFATALRDLDRIEMIEASQIDCRNPSVWPHGAKIINYMKIKTEHGITGPISFNAAGHRSQFHLEITELSEKGFTQIGTWDHQHGVNYTRNYGDFQSQIIKAISEKNFIVSSRIGAPFLMMKETLEGQVLEGNARYEGYCMDLFKEIAKELKFQFTFVLVPDGAYGSYDPKTKKWNGLVRQLLDRKADLAGCDLTITYERRTAVDFTMPFMTLGISILYAKPVKQPKELFSFLSPLSVEVWMYMGIAYIGVSILIFMLSRMSPDDWESPHPCNTEMNVENIWNMMNCIWVTMGSIMGQGSDILPKAVSTRIVCGMWWFFALIMLASYTANLAAFLTMERMDASIESAEDLAKQVKIKYGCVRDGSTMNFFKNSNFSTYQKMWTVMESERPSVFTGSNDEGRDRVLKGKRMYAFIMESTPIEYITERFCELQQIGGLLDSKGYGIAMLTNSPYRTAISGAVLKLSEGGKLAQLKDKWWKAAKKCDTASSSAAGSAAELGLDNVGGVFVVLGGGCVVALIVAIFEFLWNVKNVALEEKIAIWPALKKETKFAMNLSITTKPVHKPPSDSESPNSTKSKPLKSGSNSGTELSNNGKVLRKRKDKKDAGTGESMTVLSGPSNVFSNNKY